LKEEFKLQFSEERILRILFGFEKDKRILQVYVMKRKFLVYIMKNCSANRHGVAISCRLDGQGFEFHKKKDMLSFLKEFRSLLVRTKPPNQLGPGRGVKLNTPSSADV
jgi:hypothetical protein